MDKLAIKKHERYLKWEKEKVEKAANDLILAQAAPLVEKLIEIALADEGNVIAINSLLDRAFGKATQKIAGDKNGEPLRLVFDSVFSQQEPEHVNIKDITDSDVLEETVENKG